MAMNVVLLDDDSPHPPAAAHGRWVEGALRAAACTVVQVPACADLVQTLDQHAPDVLIVCGGTDRAALAARLSGLLPLPCALLVLTPLQVSEGLDPLLALGVDEWLDAQAPAAELWPRLALARQRWQRAQAQRKAMAQLQAQLDERKWVDRAKGLLMAGGLAEDAAFRLLRNASMHANLRLAEVSRGVVEASQWADAVNRAGQLRMLSQRLVKLAAQRLAGVEVRRARQLQDESLRRGQDILDHLAALPAWEHSDSTTATLRQAWDGVLTALSARLSPAALAHADAQAEQLLHAAEALTAAFQAQGARPALGLVNICGRQRMRAQRVAKQALLCRWLASPALTGQLTETMDEFEVALLTLERAPLSSPDIRTSLAAARDEWLRLLRGVRSADTAEGQALLARSSEALLTVLDDLTARYEHNLQLIMS